MVQLKHCFYGVLLIINVCFIQQSFASPFLNFTPSHRNVVTDQSFIRQVVHAVGKKPITEIEDIDANDVKTQKFQFQNNPFAPLLLSFNQHAIDIHWMIPTANNSDLFKANSENQKLMNNLVIFLFGNSELLTLINSQKEFSLETKTTNGLWRVKAIRKNTDVFISISFVS